MPILNLKEPERTPRNAEEPVEATSAPSAPSREQRWVAAITDELDDYRCRLKTFNSVSPEEVFAILSGITARLTEIRAQSWRNESRRMAALRSHEIDPLFTEAERQFRYHSRRHSTRVFEFDLTKTVT